MAEAELAKEKIRQFGRVILAAARQSGSQSSNGDGKEEGEGQVGNSSATHLHCDDKSIMGHLLRNDYPSDEHRIADINVFLVAGHETTAYTLCFFLYCLAKNPAAKAKLQAELDGLIPSGLPLCADHNPHRIDQKLLTLSDLSGADFLMHCLKESQRLLLHEHLIPILLRNNSSYIQNLFLLFASFPWLCCVM